MSASFPSRPEPLGSGGFGARASAASDASPRGRSAWDGRIAGLVIITITAILIGPLVLGDLRPLQAGLFLLGLYILKVTTAAVWSTRTRRRRPASNTFPFVSVLIPARNEERVIATTIAEVVAQDYRASDGTPQFEILVIDDASTDETGAILASLAAQYDFLRVLTRTMVDGGGKASALNAALPSCRGDVIVVFDADILIAPNFLSTLIAALDPAIAGVQARVRIYNGTSHRLAACQDDEFATYHRVMQHGRNALDGAVGLGGQGQAVWTSAIRRVGGWHTGASTEDLDLTVRLVLAGFRVGFCPDAVVWQEGVTNLSALLRQRRRWFAGNLRVCFAYLWPLVKAPVALGRRLDYAIYLVSLLTPFWVLLSYLVLNLRQIVTPERPLALAPVYILVSAVAYFPMIVIGLWGEMTQSPLDLVWRVVRLWGYSLLCIPISLAALWQTLVVRTPAWDKTLHVGLPARELHVGLPARELRPAERILIGQGVADGDG